MATAWPTARHVLAAGVGTGFTFLGREEVEGDLG